MLRCLCLAFMLVCVTVPVQAEVVDRVVAFLGQEVITLSELEENYAAALVQTPGVSRAQVLNTMINRLLMLREAKKLRIEAENEDAVLNDYIDLKIRAFIRISNEEIESFYNEHQSEFKGTRLSEVRDKIEALLREKEVNSRLRKHIETLRANAYIKIIYLPE